MRLETLLQHVGATSVHGSVDTDVTEVTRDSRRVRPDVVFVAVEGTAVDGHDFVPALDAAAVVVSREVTARPGVTVVRVPDTKAALARLAAALHGFPGAALKVVGVTGTNGKTTITTLVDEALRRLGRKSARIGTIGTVIDGVPVESALTTPESTELQALLSRMRDAGVEAVAMEVSSIGIVQRRVDAIPYHVGVFTNLARDHLDFHGTIEAYREAKALLFRELLRPPGGWPRAVLNADDPSSDLLGAPDDRWTYGFGPSDLQIVEMSGDPHGMRVRLRTPAGEGEIATRLVGRHNALNLAAATAVLLTLDAPLQAALAALGDVPGVAGRLEPVPNDRGFAVLVDYAHTEDALAAVLGAVRELTRGELWVVFGCGGDRDRGKRPLMGATAARLADRVVVTSDNPRSEDPLSIIDAILSGMDSATWFDPDRAAAIRYALDRAKPGDAVVIAGKGHEDYQEIRGVKHPFDDRAVAREILEGR